MVFYRTKFVSNALTGPNDDFADADELSSRQIYEVELRKDAKGLGITISGFLPGNSC